MLKVCHLIHCFTNELCGFRMRASLVLWHTPDSDKKELSRTTTSLVLNHTIWRYQAWQPMSPEVFPFRALSLEASGIVTLAKMDGIGIVTESDNSGRVHSERLSRITKKGVHGVFTSILQCSSARCGDEP